MCYDETFALVARIASVRLLVSAALQKGHIIHQMDVKTAFLYGQIDRDIYLKYPKHFKSYKEGYCLKLQKSIYGLKQASKIWYENLQQALIDNEFIESEASPCLFYKDDTYVLIYVDDILITGTPEKVQLVKDYLYSKYQIKDMGEINQFLNLTFTPIENGYTITQSRQILEILNEYQMDKCNPKSRPMVNQKIDSNSPLLTPDNQKKYTEILGKLQYLSRHTRPDIAFSVSVLYRYITKPTEYNWSQVKQILQYLKYTINVGISITSLENSDPIRGYVDANFAEDTNDRKSTSGLIIYHNNNPIIWQSAKQDTVSLSTMESEYYALSEGVKRIIWTRKLLHELFLNENFPPTPIYEDNEATIKFARGNATLHKRTMHIDRKHFFVKDHEKKNTICIKEISSNDNIADIFTKPLGSILFDKHKTTLCRVNDKYNIQNLKQNTTEITTKITT